LGTKGLLLHPNLRVFNRDFIENNFHQDMAGAKPVVIIGEENERLKHRLLILQSRRERIVGNRQSYEDDATRTDDTLKLKARDQARIPAELFGERTFDRRDLLSIVDILPIDASALLLTEVERGRLFEAWKRAGDYSTLSPLSYSTANLARSITKIPRALRTTASYQAIQRLKENSTLENWVGSGLPFHASGQACEFCGSRIAQTRWSELHGHFSKAYQDLHTLLRSRLATLSSHECNIPFPDDRSLFPDLQQQYAAARISGQSAATLINEQLAALSAALQRKIQDLESTEVINVDLSQARRLCDALMNCNATFSAHNHRVASADQVRVAARTDLINHFAAEYVSATDYRNAKAKIADFRRRAARASAVIARIDASISRVEREIKASSIAPQVINDRLRFLLGDAIEAVKVSDTDFEFRRNGQRASNMSEGERTAVAFSYFLAKLEEAGVDLEEMVIVIDDPICSLDSNHIFAVYSIIESRLSAAKQLFVLTHNTDFFSLVKDWMKSRDKSFYMVVRLLTPKQEPYSTVTKLPRLLEKFKSDYLYTYHCLKVIDADSSPPLENLCGVPNMIRRLLEAYLGFRYPGAGAWHAKLPRLLSSDFACGEIRKFTDEFSHSHYLHRAMEVPDYVAHCKRLVSEVLCALALKDPEHVASLDKELAEAGT
jgi:hypothetical protein